LEQGGTAGLNIFNIFSVFFAVAFLEQGGTAGLEPGLKEGIELVHSRGDI
jgi:hypothetical protein